MDEAAAGGFCLIRRREWRRLRGLGLNLPHFLINGHFGRVDAIMVTPLGILADLPTTDLARETARLGDAPGADLSAAVESCTKCFPCHGIVAVVAGAQHDAHDGITRKLTCNAITHQSIPPMS